MTSKLVILLLIASFAEACAPLLAAPSSLEVLQASTMLVDWDDIPPERCDPLLHGMFLSYQGGADLLDNEDAAARACAHRLNGMDRDRKLAELRCPTCESAKQWAIAGKALTVVGGGLTFGLGSLVIYDAVGRRVQ